MSVADVFNKMSGEYDQIQDLWYAWLFSRLHYIIVKEVINSYNPETVLDVGCGTGFQSFLHAAFGASVVGIDIAKRMIEVAKKKTTYFKPEEGMSLFPIYFQFVSKYNKLIDSDLRKKGDTRKYVPPRFQVADARNLPFIDKSFDHVNCCGSTLSLIEDHHCVLSEMSRVLKPGGTILLEIESRWNMDLFWYIMDAILKNRLGYNATLHEALRAISLPPSAYVSINYPFGRPEKPVYMKIKLFTVNGLMNELSEFQLVVIKRWTIHSLTSLIPSTYLDTDDTPNWMRRIFEFLANVEEMFPNYLPGCHIVLLARKRQR